MKTLIIAILFAMIAATATARIGETLEQCTNRYGKGKNYTVEGNKVLFVKGMSKDNFMYIAIEFSQDGKAGRIIYSRGLLNDGDPDRAPFSEHEIYVLLEANTGAGTIRKWRYNFGTDDSAGGMAEKMEMWGYPESVPGEFKGEWKVVAKITAKHYKEKSGLLEDFDVLELETREYAAYRVKIKKENRIREDQEFFKKAKEKLKRF